MGQLNAISGSIDGLLTLEAQIYRDDRGSFLETFNRRDFHDVGIDCEFVQDNCSVSGKGVLRGLHFQRQHPQAKLVYVLSGEIYDVAVDIRPGSKSFGKWQGIRLGGDSGRAFFIPAGFAHGFLALSDNSVVCYKEDDYYTPGDEGGIIWNDTALAIDWPLYLLDTPILSGKDTSWPTFNEAFT